MPRDDGAATLALTLTLTLTLTSLQVRRPNRCLTLTLTLTSLQMRQPNRCLTLTLTLILTLTLTLTPTSVQGSWSKRDCAATAPPPTNPASWLPTSERQPTPLSSHASSLDACISRCVRCPRCRVVSYSPMLQACQWHHTCNLSTPLWRSFEFWTFRSFRVRHPPDSVTHRHV